MKEAIVIRLMESDKQSLGILYIVNEGQLFIAKTLELPDKDNAAQISCIPKGEYICEWTLSPSFKKHTYEILDVPGRSGIRIHSANLVTQLRGCIALGSALKDINNDGLQDTIHSGNTMAEFQKIMNQEPFKLTIK